MGILTKPITAFSKFTGKFLENHEKKYRLDNKNYLDWVAVGSIIAKDTVGCYYYTTQSLHNEEIPEDKRKFVAALDLTNGILMISMQIALKILFDKHFKAPLAKKIVKKVFNQDRINKAKKSLQSRGFDIEQVEKRVADRVKYAQSNIETGVGLVSSLFVATFIAKRFIVPLISTPIAGWTEKTVFADDNSKAINKPLNVKA